MTPEGYCTTMNAYEFSRDYRVNASMDAPHYFPSTNTTYCEASDAKCQACASSPEFMATFSGQWNPSAYCVGNDGCVCVGFCESPYYADIITDAFCDASTSGSNTYMIGISGMTTDSLRIIALIVALCISIPVVAIVWCGQRGKSHLHRSFH